MRHMPWHYRRPNIDARKLKQENNTLQVTLTRLRMELNSKANYVCALESVLHERMDKVDKLNAVIDRLRQQNQQLGLKNHCLVALLVAPSSDLRTG
jgi:hypothetical protein